jgi:hypothetical protein
VKSHFTAQVRPHCQYSQHLAASTHYPRNTAPHCLSRDCECAPRSSCAALAPHTCGRASLRSRLRTAPSHRACHTVTCLRRRRWGAPRVGSCVVCVRRAGAHTASHLCERPPVPVRKYAPMPQHRARCTALVAVHSQPVCTHKYTCPISGCRLRPAHVVTRSHAFVIAPGSARADCARSLRSCPCTALVPVHCARARALRSCPCTALVPVHCARARALRLCPCTPLAPVQPHTSVSVLKRRCSARVFVCPRSRAQVDLQRPRQPHSNAGCGCAALWQHMLR